MELQKGLYTEKRSQTLELPDEKIMTSAEKLASRGMILYDKLTSQENDANLIESKKWDELAKKSKKQTKK